MSEDIHYTRDQPIWWLEQKAVFVAYRKKKIVIDVLQARNGKPRRMVELATIRPRKETQEEREEAPREETNKEPIEEGPLWTDQQLATLGKIFPGFDMWYKANYDDKGKLKPANQRPVIPGLRLPHPHETSLSEENEEQL